MTRLKSRATITDVAQRAGVSYQTVSRVINRHPSVRDVTRQRVLEAIEALRFQPNPAARRLVTRRSGIIGVVSFALHQYGPSQALRFIDAAARARGYAISFCSISALGAPEIERALALLHQQQVDGALVIAPLVDVEALHLRGADLPVVLVDARPTAHLGGAAIDQRLGGQLAANHLLDLGHREIVLLGGPPDWYDARERRGGWCDALQARQLAPLAEASGDWTAESGYRLTRALLFSAPAATAYLVGNDQMALGALRALYEAGLRVPQDVSLVGFDDTPESAHYYPPLTTVRQDFGALGQRSLELLLARLEQGTQDGDHQGREPPDPPSLAPQLVVRASSARPRPPWSPDRRGCEP